jgi:hypothetical protein
VPLIPQSQELGLEWDISALKRSGRPTQVTVPENVVAIHSMILSKNIHWKDSAAETLVISQERVGSSIYEILDMKKLPAKLVPKCLNADQKRDWALASQAILGRFQQDHVGFLTIL